MFKKILISRLTRTIVFILAMNVLALITFHELPISPALGSDKSMVVSGSEFNSANLSLVIRNCSITGRFLKMNIIIHNSGTKLLKPGNFILKARFSEKGNNIEHSAEIKPKTLVFPGRSRNLSVSFPNNCESININDITLALTTYDGCTVIVSPEKNHFPYSFYKRKSPRAHAVENSPVKPPDKKKIKRKKTGKKIEAKAEAKAESRQQSKKQSKQLKRAVRLKGELLIVTVKSGDTLYSLSETFLGNGDKYPMLAKLNDLSQPFLIHPKQELVIPLNMLARNIENSVQSAKTDPITSKSEISEKRNNETIHQVESKSGKTSGTKIDQIRLQNNLKPKNEQKTILASNQSVATALTEFSDFLEACGDKLTILTRRPPKHRNFTAGNSAKPSRKENTISISGSKVSAEAVNTSPDSTPANAADSTAQTPLSPEQSEIKTTVGNTIENVLTPDSAASDSPEKTAENSGLSSRKIGIIALVLSLFVIILGRLRLRNRMKRKRVVHYHENPLEKLK
ncbi:MAG: hypothetical protein CVV64_05875 [Candidatus Wallbacteria bacterium HGW-Wallbacteria-1]|jgi:hypothetical protein|uniref:LysM domain-containing protein n=1 Tax=Candidatus Wallbacteria bacterium HGW-Wallbacteria-1 TaxID=2013854 RepID=A0A2N1PSH7_9BACT|nr:MAG: hypothetical protein CVV64_05875 [Candidatus Wallbacteria bacterium HGW-Wallbacteria-1]